MGSVTRIRTISRIRVTLPRVFYLCCLLLLAKFECFLIGNKIDTVAKVLLKKDIKVMPLSSDRCSNTQAGENTRDTTFRLLRFVTDY